MSLALNEAYLKDNLVKVLRAGMTGAVVFRHEDKVTAGIPDMSVTLKGTTWIEVKYARPVCSGAGLQTLTCMRLAKNGSCWYVVYQELNKQKRTLIVKPEESQNLSLVPDERMAAGFNHQFVLEFIRKLHDYNKS